MNSSKGVQTENCLPIGPHQPSYPLGGYYGGGYISTYSKPQIVEVKTVRTKAGWLGQVYYRSRIVWESEPFDNEGNARRSADTHLEEVLSA
jgi:hypothetical protein